MESPPQPQPSPPQPQPSPSPQPSTSLSSRPPWYRSAASPALNLEIHATWNKARAATLHLPHHSALSPMFMPVGTQATVKGLTPAQLCNEEEYGINTQIILSNTYHLALRPGGEVISKLGGVHSFMGWKRGVLTDSGGFQMVSLLKFSEITEEGVSFQSPVDGTEILLTPEKSIEIQNNIDADIIMALDDVVSSTLKDIKRIKQACYRTLRWIDRCISSHKKFNTQNLFGIVQGGLDLNLRKICCHGLIKKNLPGYAIGGLSGGEDKDIFWRIVDCCTNILPIDKPRYCMGVGYPEDLVICVMFGVDMFDCVYPTRTARFGTAIVPWGLLKLKQCNMEEDFRPIDETCCCYTCKHYTRAYLHILSSKDGSVGAQLLSLHNIAYLTTLMTRARSAIIEGNFPAFVRDFMSKRYPNKEYPTWVRNATRKAGIDLL